MSIKNTNSLGKKKQNLVLLGFFGASHVWIQKKKIWGGGGEVRRLFEFGGEGWGPEPYIFVISNVI